MSLLSLPNELLLLIANPLGPKDLTHLLSTNHRLSTLLTPQLHTLAHTPIDNLPSLHWSILLNHLPLVTLLSTTPQLNLPCQNGWTPLHYAASSGRTHIVRHLLSLGASVTPQDAIGETALEVAAQFGSKNRYPLLTQFPAYRTAATSRPPSLWHVWVGDSEHETIVKLLLEHGADKDNIDAFGRTPLHWAVKVRNVGIVRVLLSAGVDADKMNGDGDTPLMCAVAGLSRGGEWEAGLEIVELLLEYGVDVGVQNSVGYTALHHAVMHGFTDAVVVLLKEDGVRLDAVDRWGRTALFHVLMDMRGEAVFLMLLEKGADFGVVDVEGDTVLHLAARVGMVGACRALLERGARWDVRNLDGDTAFEGIMGASAGELEMKMKKEVLLKLFLETEERDGEARLRKAEVSV